MLSRYRVKELLILEFLTPQDQISLYAKPGDYLLADQSTIWLIGDGKLRESINTISCLHDWLENNKISYERRLPYQDLMELLIKMRRDSMDYPHCKPNSTAKYYWSSIGSDDNDLGLPSVWCHPITEEAPTIKLYFESVEEAQELVSTIQGAINAVKSKELKKSIQPKGFVVIRGSKPQGVYYVSLSKKGYELTSDIEKAIKFPNPQIAWTNGSGKFVTETDIAITLVSQLDQELKFETIPYEGNKA